MGLQAVYERFVKSPSAQILADDATFQYVTTLKTFSQQSRIIKHLEEQNTNIVKKKNEKVIGAVEGLTSVALIVETTLEFLQSGGAYLPGLDTFILDRVATLPVTHFVHFNTDGKVTQIRLSWDQGDLLKQVEVIGTRGKNWPVFGGKDQIKMITASTNTANENNPAPALSPRGRTNENGNGAERSASPTKKYIKDPHASLDIFKQEEERKPSAPNAVAPRQAHRPEERDMSDLFAAGHEDYERSGKDGSPRKESKVEVVAPKGAGHKRFQPSEVFAQEEPAAPKERQVYKTNPARYNHFDIGDTDENDSFQYRKPGGNPQDMPIRPKGGRSTQHNAQWGFEGFNTPAKSQQQKVRDQDVVHFSYGDDNKQATAAKPGKGRKDDETHFEFQDNGTPVMRETKPQPRKDINSHFDITDESTPGPRRIIGRTKAAAKLYSDPVFGEEEDEQPLPNKSRGGRKDLESHWGDENNNSRQQQPAGRGRKEMEKGFWDF